MNVLFSKHKIIWFIYSLFLIIVLGVLMQYNKAGIHLFLNQFHSTFFDLFFKWVTEIGHGMFVVVVALLLAIISFRMGISMLASYLLSGLLAQIGKRILFTDALRPVKFFGEGILHTIEGVKLNHYGSFPSGHTASVFAMCFTFIFFTKNITAQVSYLLLAFVVAYSRVYLSQHFLIDIYAGSILGVASALLVFKWIGLSDKKWFDLSIIYYLRNKNNHQK